MIIIGYQGIGKSTLAGKHNIIDLESSNFWYNSRRPQNWYAYYANIAIHLSEQGYIVCISSHKEVREYLKNFYFDHSYCVFPSARLKDLWIKKLEDRFLKTGLQKDYKAWQNAELMYVKNIEDLQNSGLQHFTITDMNYCLLDIIGKLLDSDKH